MGGAGEEEVGSTLVKNVIALLINKDLHLKKRSAPEKKFLPFGEDTCSKGSQYSVKHTGSHTVISSCNYGKI